MNQDQVKQLLTQALEHERGGVKVYETALKCTVDKNLREEWTKYLEETEEHVEALTEVCAGMGVDPEQESPGRGIVRDLGASLVRAMTTARDQAEPPAAQLVACECVVLAETKDHLNWELLGQVAGKLTGAGVQRLREAYGKIEDQEDEHLYHTKGWCRELWIESLGMKAVLPPPEEQKNVKTAIGAARAEQGRESMQSHAKE